MLSSCIHKQVQGAGFSLLHLHCHVKHSLLTKGLRLEASKCVHMTPLPPPPPLKSMHCNSVKGNNTVKESAGDGGIKEYKKDVALLRAVLYYCPH